MSESNQDIHELEERARWIKAAPVAVLLALAIAVLVPAITGPRRDASGGADVSVPRDIEAPREVRMTVHPVEIRDRERTPTWRELRESYGLRNRDIEAAMRAHDRQREPGAEPTVETDTIPPGAEVALPID